MRRLVRLEPRERSRRDGAGIRTTRPFRPSAQRQARGGCRFLRLIISPARPTWSASSRRSCRRKSAAESGGSRRRRNTHAPRPRPSPRRRRAKARQPRLFLHRPTQGLGRTARRDADGRGVQGGSCGLRGSVRSAPRGVARKTVHAGLGSVAADLSSALRLDIEDDPAARDMEVLPGGLEAFNERWWPGHQPWRPLAVFVREREASSRASPAKPMPAGSSSAILLGVGQPARPRHRAKLMAAAEARALERGCHSAWVDTFGFQAPGFYPKLGYRGLRRTRLVAGPQALLPPEATRPRAGGVEGGRLTGSSAACLPAPSPPKPRTGFEIFNFSC